MDIFAHGLWTYAVYYKQKYRWLAVFFGIMPDLFSFGIFALHNLIFYGISFGKPALNAIPEYVFVGYNFTHSLVIFFIIFLVIYYITREIPWLTCGWLLHIVIDIPTHTREFFPTPFLWPISSITFNGIKWSSLYFMIINYSLIILVYAYLIISSRRLNFIQVKS